MREKVFINCPYDKQYLEIFKAIMYMCYKFGYEPVFAAESAASENRMKVIEKMIQTTSISIHDISRNEIGEYPRFNMPFELGMDYMYKCIKSKDKNLLILDNNPNDYDRTLSDLSCLDVYPHKNEVKVVIKILRDAFMKLSNVKKVPSPQSICDELTLKFNSWFYTEMSELDFKENDLEDVGYKEYKNYICEFISLNSLELL